MRHDIFYWFSLLFSLPLTSCHESSISYFLLRNNFWLLSFWVAPDSFKHYHLITDCFLLLHFHERSLFTVDSLFLGTPLNLIWFDFAFEIYINGLCSNYRKDMVSQIPRAGVRSLIPILRKLLLAFQLILLDHHKLQNQTWILRVISIREPRILGHCLTVLHGQRLAETPMMLPRFTRGLTCQQFQA